MDIPLIGKDGRTAKSIGAIVPAAALGLALALLYAETVVWMVDRFTAPASYFSHGLIVPLISIWFVWRARSGIRWGEEPAVVRGSAILLLGAALFLAGSVARIHFVAALSLVVVLAGLVILNGGKGAWRPLRFPVLYLLFLVPWPLWIVANLSLTLKLVTAEAALRVANGIGIVAIRDGATIHIGHGMGSLEVGDACSGLRYSVALLAFGAVLAKLGRSGPVGRIAVFAASLPAAIVANSARVFLLVAGGSILGATTVSGVVHDVSGILVFVFAFLILTGLDRLLARLSGGGK